MIYDSSNIAPGCITIDVTAKAVIDRVLSVDVKLGEVKLSGRSPSISATGDLAAEVARFRRIYPICIGDGLPIAFHCYGKV